jgi:uncharacterized RDD family membrane protein YckC
MKTIELTTTQQVTIEYQLARLQERIFAYVLDWLVLLALLWVLTIFGAIMQLYYFFGGFLMLVMFFSYHFLCEWLMNGQSLGKKAMGIRVVKLNGREATLSDYLLRVSFHLIDTLFSFGLVATIFITSSNRNQRLGDITANTAVIRTRPDQQFSLKDILKINDLSDYEPTYPQVSQFSEQDMLLVKNAIARRARFGNAAHRTALNELCQQLASKMELQKVPKDKMAFLKTVVRDYIVLTR